MGMFTRQVSSRLSFFLKNIKNTSSTFNNQTRSYICSETGALVEEPGKVAFGVVKVIMTVTPGLYLGATLSKQGAAFLEENDIFVPEEDDD